MHLGGIGRVASIVLVATSLSLPAPARAGVPRACIWPTYDPLECPVELRQQLAKVTNPRRMRIREQLRERIREGQIPTQPGPLRPNPTAPRR